MGLPRTLPPKSSTAICAAVTEPWPVGVEAGPFMSVRTPILTTSSETCPSAAGADNITDAAAASMDSLEAEITKYPPVSSGALAGLLDRRASLIRYSCLNSHSAPMRLIESSSVNRTAERRPGKLSSVAYERNDGGARPLASVRILRAVTTPRRQQAKLANTLTPWSTIAVWSRPSACRLYLLRLKQHSRLCSSRS